MTNQSKRDAKEVFEEASDHAWRVLAEAIAPHERAYLAALDKASRVFLEIENDNA